VNLTFAQRIIRARLLFGAWADIPREVDYAEVARALDLTPGNIGHWEAGRHEPGRENAAKLADYLGVRLEWLEYGRGDMYDGGDDRPAIQPPQLPPSEPTTATRIPVEIEHEVARTQTEPPPEQPPAKRRPPSTDAEQRALQADPPQGSPRRRPGRQERGS
jgi:transcriptional regulator with XRE-family HTH domain